MRDTISLLGVLSALLLVLSIVGMFSAIEHNKWIPRIVCSPRIDDNDGCWQYSILVIVGMVMLSATGIYVVLMNGQVSLTAQVG